MTRNIRLTIKRRYGELALEGSSVEEVESLLQEMPRLDEAMKAIQESEKLLHAGAELEGIVTYSGEKPIIVVRKELMTIREAILLLLYASNSEELRASEINEQLTESGILSAGYNARISEMTREGLIVKGEGGYKLTEQGKLLVKDVIKRIKGVEDVE
jgi:predicted transcriptional regulator